MTLPPRPIRTVQVVNVRWFNATAWYGIKLAQALGQAGHPTLLLGLEGTESFERAREMGLNPVGLPLNSKNPLKQPLLLSRISRLLRDFRPDIVNCHRGESFALFALLKQRLGYCLARTRGDQRLPRNSAANRWLHARVADAVVATNSRMARCFINELHVPESRVHQVIGGVDVKAFAFDPAGRERVRAEFGFGPEDRVVGLLGRLDVVKGQKELIEAAALLRREGGQEGRRTRLLLVGHDAIYNEAEIRAFAREAGMAEDTVITGLRPDVAACISAMDLGVVASLYSEAIARAALEIMACDRPLVGTNVGVMPDLLPAEALCAPADVPGLAGLVGRALAEQSFCAALVEENRRRMAGLSIERFVGSTLEIYSSLLALKGK